MLQRSREVKFVNAVIANNISLVYLIVLYLPFRLKTLLDYFVKELSIKVLIVILADVKGQEVYIVYTIKRLNM